MPNISSSIKDQAIGKESFAEEMEEADLRITYQEVRWGEIWAEVGPDAA